MSELDDLRLRMEDAAARADFEEAARLRDRISLLRAGAEGDFDPSGLERQQPGRMGIGTSHPVVTRPQGWKPPPKPDPMTRGRSRPKRGR